jgi:hypothetical protein
MPADQFAYAFGEEAYILCGPRPPSIGTDLFEGI